MALDAQRIGKRIASEVIEKDIELDDLARQLHVTKNSIYRWLRGENLPKLDTLAELSEVLETSIDYLIFGEREERRNGDE